jgi:putative endonuclease
VGSFGAFGPQDDSDIASISSSSSDHLLSFCCHPEAAKRPKDPTRNERPHGADGKPMRGPHYVYIVTGLSLNRVLYVGVTSNLRARIQAHREGRLGGFTARYRLSKLVHAEPFQYVRDAIAREKQLKGWRRDRKIALIERNNPEWRELTVAAWGRE